MQSSRSQVVSSFTIIKGSLIPETYAAFQQWDLTRSQSENLKRLKETNAIGAKSANWLRDIAFVLSRRFDPAGRDRPLVELARAHCNLTIWKPILLWHMTRDEFLVRDFLIHRLFPAFADGAYRIRAEDLLPYLQALPGKGVAIEPWTDSTRKRVATALLRMGVDFGLLKGILAKDLASYHLPDESFLYLLHALADGEPNARKLIESPEWRIYLMHPTDVERELFRLHQFRRVQYEVAGSLAQLTLPCRSSLDYARGLGA